MVPNAPKSDLRPKAKALGVVKSVGGATWSVARNLNPFRLFWASQKTRLLVAGSVLGLGTAGGVVTVMTAKDMKNPAVADVVPSDAAKRELRASQPVKPIPDADDEAPIRPPPSAFFSPRDNASSRPISRGQSPTPQDFAQNDQGPAALNNADSPYGARRRFGSGNESIQQVADTAPAEGNSAEPRSLPVSIGDAAPNSYAPPPPNNSFVEPTAATEPASNNSVPPQEIPPPKPPAINFGDGGGNLRPPPDLGPPPSNFGQRDFGNPPDNGANNRFGSPPPATLPPNNFGSQPPASNPPPAVPDTSFGDMRSRPSSGGDRFNSGAGSAMSIPAAGLGAASLAGDGTSLASPTPGTKQLEGLQTPSLALEKIAPPDVQVGKPAKFITKVRNVGQVAAHQVAVVDHIPAGARFAEATPQPTQSPDGSLLWKIGTLQPGDEAVITMQVVPEREGEIGSVAQLLFQSQASVRAVCTKPQLVLKHTAPQKALIGDSVMLTISVTNSGTGIASGIILSENVPEQLTHPAGTELEYEIGSLRPGETKQVTLALKAAKPGLARNLVTAGNETNASAQDETQIEVVAPQLELALNGPRVRYLERQATYNVILSNPGTAPAHNVELVTFLPRGFKFLSADKNGQYDSQNHAVFWSLEQLPAGVNGEVQVTALPIEIGEQKFRVESRANLGLQKVLEQVVQVEGLSELQFSVSDVADPIEVGTDTVYEIKLTNRGHKPATNVQIAIAFPPDMQPISGDGPSRVVVQGNQIAIEPMARMAAGAQALYKIQARGMRAGDQRIRVQLMSDESPNPVSKEESTRVYADK